MVPYPEWLHALAWFSLGLAFLSGIVIIADMLRGDRQKMWIMSLVWPITALYWGPLAVWGYFRYGRLSTIQHEKQMKARMGEQRMKEIEEQAKKDGRVLPPQVGVGVSHCGAGCTLGDITGEWLVFMLGLSFAGSAFTTDLVLDFLFAWTFGIAFQYFTIVPMRGMSPLKGIGAAMKADTLSIVAFQIGLFGWMALAHFVLFPGPHTHPDEAVHWFMMQIGMVIGYFTAWPANHVLLKMGWKERMPKTHMLELRQKQQLPERRVA
jgi:hypothetical protein